MGEEVGSDSARFVKPRSRWNCRSPVEMVERVEASIPCVRLGYGESSVVARREREASERERESARSK